MIAAAGEGGVILTFYVEENPVVRQISITGNENVDGEKIREGLTLTTGSTLDYPLLFENTKRIEALYRAEGYYPDSSQWHYPGWASTSCQIRRRHRSDS